MTTLLQQAFEKASTLPNSEQNAIAEWLIAELESERQWDKLFATSSSLLEQLAADALEEHTRGETKPVTISAE